MAAIGDIVLIYREENPIFFARIEDIWADRKPGWFHVKFLVLQLPVVEIAWILREAYIHGETFTMDGKNVRLEVVRKALTQSQPSSPEKGKDSITKQQPAQGNVISLFDRKKEE